MKKTPFTIEIEASKSSVIYLAGATYLRVRELNLDVRARLDDADIGILSVGDRMHVADGTTKLYIENINNEPIKLTLEMATGEITSDSLILSGTIKTENVPTSNIATKNESLTQTKKKIVDSSTSRKEINISNTSSHTIKIGGSDVVNANGWSLRAGEKESIPFKGELWAKCVEDVTIEIEIMELY